MSVGRRGALVLGLLASVFLTLLGIAYTIIRHRVDAKLKAAIAEADRLDPGWRFDQLLAKRRRVSEAENSARVIEAVERSIPKDWLGSGPGGAGKDGLRGAGLYAALTALPPDVPLGDAQVAGLRAELAPLAQARAEARRLAEMPAGRFEITPTKSMFDLALDHIQGVRSVVRLLQLDAILRIQEGDIDQALEDCRAIINTGRAFGDEPFSISQLTRFGFEQVTLAILDRALAQGQASDAALARLQTGLATEANEPLLLTMLRGERAILDDTMAKLGDGRMRLGEIAWFGREAAGLDWMPVGLLVRYNRGLGLGFLNQAVEIAKRPVSEQAPLWEGWEASIRPPRGGFATRAGFLTYLLLPPGKNFAQGYLRTRAELACGVALIAVERDRMARGHWAESLAQVPKTVLAAPPIDPFSGGLVRTKRVKNSLVVYSVGPDRTDNDGKLDPKRRRSNAPGTDWGFQLWDPKHRGKASRPKPDPAAPRTDR